MRGLTFEPRGDGRAQPIEHDELTVPPAPGHGERVTLRRSARRLPRLLLACLLAGTGVAATFRLIEVAPPALPLILIAQVAVIAALIESRAVRGRRLREACSTILHLRGELSLCLEQRAEGRERIRQLMLQLNQKGDAA